MLTPARSRLLLLFVLGFAAWLRLTGLNWDEGTYPHPDERFLSMVAHGLHAAELSPPERDEGARRSHLQRCRDRNHSASGIGGWFDTECSNFNPANTGNPSYPYGQLPLTAVRLSAEAMSTATGWPGWSRYGAIDLVGRALSAGVDLLTVLVCFLLGRLLWSRAVGVLAAAFYAFSVLPVQSAHYFTVDSWATLAAAVCVLFLIRIVRSGELADIIAFGFAYGLALSCKLSLLPLALLLPVALFWAPPRYVLQGRSTWIARLALLLPDLSVGIVAGFFMFRLSSPYVFAGPHWFNVAPNTAYFDYLEELRRIVYGISDIPPSWQWLARIPILSPARDLLFWGLGPPLGIAVVAGVVFLGWRLLRGSAVQKARAIAWLWTVGYFFWMAHQWQSTMRYLLPVYPLLCVFAAAGLAVAWRARPGRRSIPAVTVLVLGLTGMWAFAFHSVYTRLHPYVAASHWFLRNVPAGASAPLVTDSNEQVLVNWAASGVFGDRNPERTLHTRAPANGIIDRVLLHDVKVNGDGTVHIEAVLLHPDGSDWIRGSAEARAHVRELALHLTQPFVMSGGQDYSLKLEISGGSAEISGAAIAYEGAWNDPLPMNVPWLAPTATLDPQAPSGRTPRGGPGVDPFAERHYRMLDLGIVDEDDAAKRERMLHVLDEAEWLVLPNNRFYDAMLGNPLRFPLTVRFYDALFRGELGFERAMTLTSMPSLAGAVIVDQALPGPGQGISDQARSRWWAAEEAFSVYDHPSVFVFRRSGEYSPEAARLAFEQVSTVELQAALSAQEKPQVAGRIAWSSLAAQQAPDGILLSAASGAPLPASGTTNVFFGLLAWYFVSFALGCLALPGLASLCPRLADCGYGLARTAGLLVVGCLAWWLSWLGLPAWSFPGLVAVSALLLGTVGGGMWRTRVAAIIATNLSAIVRIELLFLALFCVGLGLRLLHPDLWAPNLGGEKPMEYAFLNSVLQTTSFPPPDPWFSGGRLNYYYFGWVLTGVLIKLSGVAPSLGFNFALATWFAMTGTAMYSLASSVFATAADAQRSSVPRLAWIAGATALAACELLGNLDLPRAVWPNLKAVAEVLHAPGSLDLGALAEAATRASERWYWAPSRTVGERPGSAWEVNEFPLFSFIQGDLHPHLMALPLQILALALIFALAWPTGDGRSPTRRSFVSRIAALGAVVALLRAVNSWDWPLYLGLSLLATIIAATRAETRWTERHRWSAIGRIALPTLVLLIVQALVALPFTIYFTTGSVSLRLFEGRMTPLTAWLAMQGWFLAVLLPWCWILARIPLSELEANNPSIHRWRCRLLAVRALGVAITALLLVYAFVMDVDVPAIALQLALSAWLLELLWRHRHQRIESIGLSAALVAVALDIAVEFVVVGEDMGRMNTYFKFHLQAWLLLSLASGIAFASLLSNVNFKQRLWQGYATILIALTSIAAAYLPLASFGRAHTRFEPHAGPSLDGEAFLAHAVYDYNGKQLVLADDYRMIRWLREHGASRDVILEAQTPEYRWGSRMSVFTGLPTLLGYRYHESQQRPIVELRKAVELRRDNVKGLYETLDTQRCLQALHHYDVRFVVVGGLERALYSPGGLAKFHVLAQAGKLTEVFQSGEDVIYEVTGRASEPGAHW